MAGAGTVHTSSVSISMKTCCESPEPVTAHIGRLQVHSGCKGQGVGRRAHDRLDWIEEWPGIPRLRAAIVQTNAEPAAPFREALGYPCRPAQTL